MYIPECKQGNSGKIIIFGYTVFFVIIKIMIVFYIYFYCYMRFAVIIINYIWQKNVKTCKKQAY